MPLDRFSVRKQCQKNTVQDQTPWIMPQLALREEKMSVHCTIKCITFCIFGDSARNCHSYNLALQYHKPKKRTITISREEQKVTKLLTSSQIMVKVASIMLIIYIIFGTIHCHSQYNLIVCAINSVSYQHLILWIDQQNTTSATLRNC